MAVNLPGGRPGTLTSAQVQIRVACLRRCATPVPPLLNTTPRFRRASPSPNPGPVGYSRFINVPLQARGWNTIKCQSVGEVRKSVGRKSCCCCLLGRFRRRPPSWRRLQSVGRSEKLLLLPRSDKHLCDRMPRQPLPAHLRQALSLDVLPASIFGAQAHAAVHVLRMYLPSLACVLPRTTSLHIQCTESYREA